MKELMICPKAKECRLENDEREKCKHSIAHNETSVGCECSPEMGDPCPSCTPYKDESMKVVSSVVQISEEQAKSMILEFTTHDIEDFIKIWRFTGYILPKPSAVREARQYWNDNIAEKEFPMKEYDLLDGIRQHYERAVSELEAEVKRLKELK